MRPIDPGTDDIAGLAALHAEAFAEAWSEGFFRDLLAAPGVFAYRDGEGFILARAAGGEAEILTLAVAPQARGKGIGGRLVRKAARHALGLGARTLFLEVASDNIAALALYGGLGFKPVGLRKAYYGDSDAQILKTALPLSRA